MPSPSPSPPGFPVASDPAGAVGSPGRLGGHSSVPGSALTDPLAMPIAPAAVRWPSTPLPTPSLAALLVPRPAASYATVHADPPAPAPAATARQALAGPPDAPPGSAPASDGAAPVAVEGQFTPVGSADPDRTGRPRASSSGRRLVVVALGVTVALAVVAGSGGYAWHTRQQSQHNFRAARAWEAEAEAARLVAEQQAIELDRLRTELAALRVEIDTLTADRDAATGRADGLQALLEDANRRLAESEQRIAELAGAQARAADQAILTR